jgi:uncharacterized protein
VLLASLLLALGVACAQEPPPPGPGAEASAPTAPTLTAEHYAEELRAWQAAREASLLEPGGWLSLVGLHWLEEGATTFGAGPDNHLVFPEGAPELGGTFRRAGAEVSVEAALGSNLRRAAGDAEGGGMDFTLTGGPVSALPLAADTTGKPTVLALGSLRFWVIERGDRLGVRVVDLESPALAGFEGLDYFPADPAWRIEARLERSSGATVAVPNVLGQVDEQATPGALVFADPASGEKLRLVPTQENGGELFVVFGDGTNRGETYGGGRFLYAEAPGADDRVVLDFNRAYNPPCAYTPYATCPLPPAENKLAVRIEAGEKRYTGEVPH